MAGISSLIDMFGNLRTSDVSLVSHVHGRQRRAERSIDRIELQEARKYGRMEHSHPGRDGRPRFKFSHNGVVYVTDETMRHEITSWRLEDDVPNPLPAAAGATYAKSHTIIVVDSSGSMRKNDVPGYATRTAAVYNCLKRELVEPQLKLTNVGESAVTLIEMGDTAEILCERVPIDAAFSNLLDSRASSWARSHGNYLPALDTAYDILVKDRDKQLQLLLVFLSDGAPSDHQWRACEHGVNVWQPDTSGRRQANGKAALLKCSDAGGWGCRKRLHEVVEAEALEKIRKLGDLCGRDRLAVHTVAFGPPSEDYRVLNEMSKQLPRGSFQKLGLSAHGLTSTFSTLSSTLSTLRTSVIDDGGPTRTARVKQRDELSALALPRPEYIYPEAGWACYTGTNGNMWSVVSRQKYDVLKSRFVDLKIFEAGGNGVAMNYKWFAKGAERFAFYCTEIAGTSTSGFEAVGGWLVAKETLYAEDLDDRKFHDRMAKAQAEAGALAELFNQRLRGPPEWHVSFVECVIYCVVDSNYAGHRARILAERQLDGAFTKWNNNGGAVLKSPHPKVPRKNGRGAASLGGILEGDEDEDDEEEDDDDADAVEPGDVAQCFSHFTYSVTDGKKLVCDLQGVWNEVDGFVLTDPVIHSRDKEHRGRATDKGQDGFERFFQSHKCNRLCKSLGLKAFDPVRNRSSSRHRDPRQASEHEPR